MDAPMPPLHIWRSEDNLVDLDVSIPLSWVLGITLRSLGLHAKISFISNSASLQITNSLKGFVDAQVNIYMFYCFLFYLDF